MSLLEAAMLLADGEAERVLVSIAEESLPEPIHACAPHVALGVAFALSTQADGARAELDLPRRERVAPSEVPSRFAGHPAEGALRLVDALETAGPHDLALSDDWALRIERV
ncbi:MAG: beta-ketoacyl synthase chain length factor [Polyangiales bacterium]